MKVIVIGLLVLLGFRSSSVGKDTNGGASGVSAVLKGLNAKIVTQVHVDVTVVRNGQPVTKRLVLDNLEYNEATLKFISTDAKYSTVKDFNTNSEFLTACTENQKWFYEALAGKDGAVVTKIKNASTKRGMQDFLQIQKNGDIPLTSFEAVILPSIKANKGAVNTNKLKNVKTLFQ